MAKPSSRALWSGSITFGLVTIPVKLFPAVKEERVRFHLLHDSDHARLQRKMVCSADGEEVTSEHMVRGFEIAPDQYVVMSDDEIESAQPKRTKAIAIEDFVGADEIDPVYFNSAYYVLPQETGTKPYQLLVQAMVESQRVAIARFVLREREHLCALRPAQEAIVLETLHYADEVVPLDAMDGVPRSAKSDPREIKMAQQLIASLETSFDPEKYHDEFSRQLKEMVQRKAAGEEVVAAPEPEKPARAGNLLEALQASLAAARAGRGTASIGSSDRPDAKPARHRGTGKGDKRSTAPEAPAARSRAARRKKAQ
jgi:DNA end-binding protein Ku